jgi:hypothetical protein
MPARKPFKRSISTIQPEPIPIVAPSFGTLPTTQNESIPADNRVDSPALVPDGYASAARGAVFVDVNTNRITPTGQVTGVQLEKDASKFLGVKTSPRRCDLLSISTPFLDIPDSQLSELVNVRTLENELDEADLLLIGKSVPSITGSFSNSRSSVTRIMNGLTDLVIHTEKPLESLNIVKSSKDIITAVQESVVDLDLPCEQPNYDIQDLCGIEDDAEVQPSTRIFSIALAAIANDGDPGGEFVVKSTSTAMTKLAGKSVKFVTSMKSSTVGKKTVSKSAENPTNAKDQNSIKKFSVKSPTQGIGRTIVKSTDSENTRYEIPVTAIADRWDDLDEVIKQSEKVVRSFIYYDNFDLARQGKPVKSSTSIAKSSANLKSSSLSGAAKSSSAGTAAAKASSTSMSGGVSRAAVSGKSDRSASRASTVGTTKQSSSKAGSKTSSSSKGTKTSGIKSSVSARPASSRGSISSVIKEATETSSTRSSLIISRICSSISNILRREMMLMRTNNLGINASDKNDKVTTFTRSLMSTKSSVSSLSLTSIGSSCTGKIVATHVDDKKSIILLEPRTFSNKKKTYTGAYENLIVPAVRYPGNNTPITSYVDNLRSNVISPIDQLLNIMLVDIANVITPTVVLRTAFAEVAAALSSLEEIISQNGGGTANEQMIELICMNLYASPGFKRRSKNVIYDKFLNPDKQYSFDGSSGSVSSSLSDPDSKVVVKMKTTSNGETTETLSEVETKNQTNEEDDSKSSPGDFAEDISSIRKIQAGKNYSGYNDEVSAERAGTLTFQTRTSEMLDTFGKSGDSTTLSQAVNTIVEKLLEACKSAIGSSILSDDESELKETGLSMTALTFMVFDLVSEICRSFYFVYIFKDTGATNYEGTSAEDPSFTISLKSSKDQKGDCQSPSESFSNDVAESISESTGALLSTKEISSGSKMIQAVAKEIQEYENDIRDHYARVFALDEMFDTIYQSFDEFRNLLTGGDIGYARQQLSSRESTKKTIELLDSKILSDCKWRFDNRLRSVFDGTYASSRHEIDTISHLFRSRNSIVTNDVIGNSLNSLLCVVGVPYGMSPTNKDDFEPKSQLIEVTLSKRDIEFQGLIFEDVKFSFDSSMRVVVKPQSLADTFQTLVEKRTQYFVFVNGAWQAVKYQDAVKRIVTNMKVKDSEAVQVIRNHVIDFMSKCFLRYVSMMEYSIENLFKSQKKVSTEAPSQVLTINSRLPIAPQGTTIADFMRLAPGGYSLAPGPHAIDGSNEADSRLIYRLLQDPAFSGNFLIDEIFSSLPYEETFCIVVDPDTFPIKTTGAVPAASYSSLIESLGEVTSIKDPGSSIIVSTKTGKFMRQRDDLRRFSGSEIAATCSVVTPRKAAGKPLTGQSGFSSKTSNKSGKFGYKTPGRRS